MDFFGNSADFGSPDLPNAPYAPSQTWVSVIPLAIRIQKCVVTFSGRKKTLLGMGSRTNSEMEEKGLLNLGDEIETSTAVAILFQTRC